MVVNYVYKRNRRTFYKQLDQRIRQMIQLCADDLTLSGFTGEVQIIFQTGKSRAESHLHGMCCFFRRPLPTIYIYTRYRRIMTILDTIAHEFGHIAHFVLYPKSHTHWCKDYREQFAERYAKIMLERWNGVNTA